MTPQLLFYILIGILIINFLIDKILDAVNAKHFNDEIPETLKDVYKEQEYRKSQQYKEVNYRFGNVSTLFSLSITLIFFFLDGFELVDKIARSYSDNNIIIALVFFAIIMLGNGLISLPFSYYQTFVIEEKFGFNKTSKKTFVLDKIKSSFMTAIIGGGMLSLVLWFFQMTGQNFWIYAWIIVALFSVFINMFYSKLIVPLFNKQAPLEDGQLKDAINEYAEKVGFTLENIFVIDGSKRSTKANAYFSGFGAQKRITLYDTLIHDL